jgi:hypothetical protein
MGDFLIGCSGQNHEDTPNKGGWIDVFYPDRETWCLGYIILNSITQLVDI